MKRSLLFLPALVLLALGFASVASGTTKRRPKPATKTVNVIDDVYTCRGCKASGTARASIRVKPGTILKWVWAAGNQNTHDVNLRSGPKHYRKFHSALAATDFSFKRALTKVGTYKIYCSIHTTMRLVVTVKK